MSGARAALRSSVFALALAAAATPAGLAVAAKGDKGAGPPPTTVNAYRAPQASPLDVRVGQGNGFTRIELHWRSPVGYVVRREGDDVILRFSRDADPDISRLRVDPPPFLKTATARRQGHVLELALTLQPGVEVKTGQDSGAIYVNLFQKPAAGEAPVADAPRVDPVPASGKVQMTGEIASGQVLLHFPWRAPVGAAAFRRGEAVWVVFDTPAKIDVSGAPAETSAFKGLKVVEGQGFVAVRVSSPELVQAKAWAEGSTWTVALGPGVQKPATPIRAERDPESAVPSLRAGIAGATKTLWLDDPAVGDRIGVVTALGPAKGVPGRRTYVDFSLLASAQGLALEPKASDLSLAVDGEWVRIGRPKGLAISTVTAAAGHGGGPEALGLPQPATMPGLIDYAAWSRTGDSGFMARYGQLQSAAADEMNREAGGDRGAGLNARMGLARFLVGSELSYETIGVLQGLLHKHPELAGDPEFRGIRGAARAMAGRFKEAENDLSAPSLTDDPASALWRGYVAAQESDWATASDNFVKGQSALNQFVPAWQVRFARAYAEAALQQGKLRTASTEVALAIAQTNDPVEQLYARLIQARLIEAMGYPKQALPLYDAVARTPFDKLSEPAQMHAAQVRLALGKIDYNQAVSVLDGLRFRWRGGREELELIRNLGRMYLAQGHYREAMETLRSIAGQPIVAPEMDDVHADLAKTFRVLFLDGAADGLEPVQALALFYDFKDLTPVGADGDLMVRKLARRLVDVDLLDDAAKLLKYQAENRLDGAARAQVSTDLATLYLMDKKPEQAIEAINNSRTTILSKDLQEQRRLLEARAWLDLDQSDHALELVAKDNAPEADGIRAEVAWRSRDWLKVGPLFEKMLGDRWKNAAPLQPDEEAELLRAGIAYSMAADDGALDRLRGRYGALVDQARSADSLKVALAGTAGVQVPTRDFSKVAADADMFTGWVTRMKQRFRDAPPPTGGGKPKLAGVDLDLRG